MKRLLEIGFTKAGYWVLNEDRIKVILSEHESKNNVLYSFICNSEIKYIGKTTNKLQARMYQYQNPGPTQSTNIKVNQKIFHFLKQGISVEIYVFIDHEPRKHGPYAVNLAAGLEDTLIQELKPEWNGMRKENTPGISQGSVKNMDNSKNISNAKDVFGVRIGFAYYNQGFFNVRKQYSDLFGEDNTFIEIQLGDTQEETITGRIDRCANPNHTPRIMCGTAFRHWIQKNFKMDDVFAVKFLSPGKIMLFKPKQ